MVDLKCSGLPVDRIEGEGGDLRRTQAVAGRQMEFEIITPPSLVCPIDGVEKLLDQIPGESTGRTFSLIDPRCIDLGGLVENFPLVMTEVEE